ncbi:MAG: S8 family serine peptidase, partial [Clostridia bacterium]|nr:S8 family serine peptidase [Clostridia bacterium]
SVDYNKLPTVGGTNSQQKNENNKLDSLIGDPNGKLNFFEIIESNKDEEYRSSVEIKDDTLVIVRNETEITPSIEDEDWYAAEGFLGYETVSESVDAVTGEKLVVYRLQTGGADVWALTDKLNDSNAVVAAEPDYIFHICDVPSAESNVGISSQWYLEQLDMFSIWGDESVYGNATGEGTIVAVIDTGVDYGHEDLKDNMWINTAELLGEDGVDDDGNGYIDDIYGVSFIDSKATPMDDNGHGTHVAGIIAMADNNVGGVGIAYNAKIMAIKAGQSDGTLSSSDIAKAIEYARKNGADVINMSFGSYAHSAVVEAALQDAFSTCVLVAAAGNDGLPTLDAIALCKANMYPAAYSYVIGVMASDSFGNLASFSNWDFRPNYGAEYEVMAPGANIYSTLPGDRYASWSGTSMATPVVSAVAAIIRSANPDKSVYNSRYIMGQIASATEDQYFYPYAAGPYAVLNAKDSITKMPKPKITIDEVYIFDSTDIAPENNGDGIIQPGETIDIAVGLRNQWGAATNVCITVESVSGQPGVVHPYVTYITNSFVNVDDIGTFQKQNNGFVYNELNTVVGVSNPVRVKISENAPNDAHIAFYINYTASNLLDLEDTAVYSLENDYVYSLTVQNGVVLKGKITQNMTLTPDNYYIIENSLLIPRGVTVNVDPGTQIQFWSTDSSTVYGDTNIAYIQVEGTLNINGTQENPVTLSLGKDYEMYPVEIKRVNKGVVNMSYASIMNPVLDITTGDHLSMMQDYDYIIIRSLDENGTINDYGSRCDIRAESIKYSKISNIRGNEYWSRAYVRGSYDTVLFENCQISYQEFSAVNCTFLINQGRVEDEWS